MRNTSLVPTRTLLLLMLFASWDLVAGQPLTAMASVVGLLGSVPFALVGALRSRQLVTRGSVRMALLLAARGELRSVPTQSLGG